MAATKKTAPQFVWVFENRWDDRHGEQGSNVKVFATKAKADAYFAQDIKNYLENYEVLTSDGNVDAGSVISLNTNDLELGAEKWVNGEFAGKPTPELEQARNMSRRLADEWDTDL